MENAIRFEKDPRPDWDPGEPRRVDLGRGSDLLVAGTGERVLLLHGWGLHPPVFRTTLQRLAHRGFEVAAPSLSVVGRRWDLERAVHRVDKSLELLGWDDAIVVGYSLGGAVATGFAASSPSRVRLLALVNSVGLRVDRGMLAWAAPMARYARASNLPAMRAFGRNALRMRGLQNLADAAQYARIAHLDAELARVREQRVPAVVLWSENDRLLPVAMGRQIADALGAPIHVVPRADHDWPVGAPEVFARELDLMLKTMLADGRQRRVRPRRPARGARLDTL
ncbi:MAG TPA: alpha/beta fold hydrolase [Actinomycetota bacterium]|jgi:pimeloyl-ACP methyl ester carboxylesterase|nr:alpha/beta fold hydrolase [Actinomycetota bacterium]